MIQPRLRAGWWSLFPFSGWILQSFAKIGGLDGRQRLFLLEGLPSMVMGESVLFYLDDGIREAKWLTETDREMLLTNLEGKQRTKAHLWAYG
jgi:hypothetical protein